MEKWIINIMKLRGLDKLHLEYLIDLGDEYIDEDGETYPITCNTIAILDDEVYIYDDCLEDEDGYVGKGDVHFFNDLDKSQQEYVLWGLNATLEYLDKNNS